MTDLPHVPGIADDFRIGSSTNLRESPIFEESTENIWVCLKIGYIPNEIAI